MTCPRLWSNSLEESWIFSVPQQRMWSWTCGKESLKLQWPVINQLFCSPDPTTVILTSACTGKKDFYPRQCICFVLALVKNHLCPACLHYAVTQYAGFLWDKPLSALLRKNFTLQINASNKPFRNTSGWIVGMNISVQLVQACAGIWCWKELLVMSVGNFK